MAREAGTKPTLVATEASESAKTVPSLTSRDPATARTVEDYSSVIRSAAEDRSRGSLFAVADKVIDEDGDHGEIVAVDEADADRPYHVRYASGSYWVGARTLKLAPRLTLQT